MRGNSMKRGCAAALNSSERWKTELKTLGMRNAVFEVRLTTADGDSGLAGDGLKLGPDGIDECEFNIAPNLGQPPMGLAKIASGGELSRVMLALKRLEAQRRGVATMIFDEVDAGIGGAIAEVVGRKLRGAVAVSPDPLHHSSTADRVVCRPSFPGRKGRTARRDRQQGNRVGQAATGRGTGADAGRRRGQRPLPARRARTARTRPSVAGPRKLVMNS